MSETHLSCPENGEDHCILLVCPFSPHTLEREAETITNISGAADVKENLIFVIQPQGQVQREGKRNQDCKQIKKAVLHW